MNGMRAIHPGEILKDEPDDLRLSANAFAKALDVPANRIQRSLKEQHYRRYRPAFCLVLRYYARFLDESAKQLRCQNGA